MQRITRLPRDVLQECCRVGHIGGPAPLCLSREEGRADRGRLRLGATRVHLARRPCHATDGQVDWRFTFKVERP